MSKSDAVAETETTEQGDALAEFKTALRECAAHIDDAGTLELWLSFVRMTKLAGAAMRADGDTMQQVAIELRPELEQQRTAAAVNRALSGVVGGSL